MQNIAVIIFIKQNCTCLKSSSWWGLAPGFWVWVLWIRKRVTGRFWTSSLHTSHVLLPLILNHLIAHSWWAKASSPLQQHSIFNVSPPSHSSIRQILHTASSSAISSPSSPSFSEQVKVIKSSYWQHLGLETIYFKSN